MKSFITRILAHIKLLLHLRVVALDVGLHSKAIYHFSKILEGRCIKPWLTTPPVGSSTTPEPSPYTPSRNHLLPPSLNPFIASYTPSTTSNTLSSSATPSSMNASYYVVPTVDLSWTMKVFTFLKNNDLIAKGHKSRVHIFKRETERGFNGVLTFTESERASSGDIDGVWDSFDGDNR